MSIKRIKEQALMTVLALLSHQAIADTLGGLNKAKSVMDDIKTGLYAVVSVAALIYLLYVGIMAMTEKKTWADFGWAVVHVAVLGGAVAIGTWAFGLFL